LLATTNQEKFQNQQQNFFKKKSNEKRRCGIRSKSERRSAITLEEAEAAGERGLERDGGERGHRDGGGGRGGCRD